MGFFKNLFGGGSPQDDMNKLLQGPSTKMANEMERVYRNQLEIVQDEFPTKDLLNSVELSAKGILKARLFGVTFMLFAFGSKWKNEADLSVMMNASSGVAMVPFASPSYQPKMDRATAASFSGEFMMEVFRAIASEMKDGSSASKNRSDGFNSLASLYEDALKESIQGVHTNEICERLSHM